MALPTIKDKGLAESKVKTILKLIGGTAHCSNCREDRGSDKVIVRQAGVGRYFIFCKVCDMDIRMISTVAPVKKVATPPTPAEAKAALEILKTGVVPVKKVKKNKATKKKATAKKKSKKKAIAKEVVEEIG